MERLVTLTFGSGHTAYRHASLIDLCQISLKLNKHFEDGWTYTRMDGRTFQTHFIRSTQKSRPKEAHYRFFFPNCVAASIKQSVLIHLSDSLQHRLQSTLQPNHKYGSKLFTQIRRISWQNARIHGGRSNSRILRISQWP